MQTMFKGVGFKTADEIAASKVGIHTDSDFRIRSGIFYVLLQSVTDGHVYLPQEELLRRTMQLLEVEICDIQKYLMDLAMEKKVVLKRERRWNPGVSGALLLFRVKYGKDASRFECFLRYCGGCD